MREPLGIAGPQQGTPEWHAERMRGFGSSEAAIACGESKYKTPLDLYCVKRGLVEPDPDNKRMRMGRRHESTIVEEYEFRTGLKVHRPIPLYRSTENDFIFASPDGLVLNNGECDRGLECKATNWRQAAQLGAEGTDFVFEEWLLQCQQQMYVTGLARWDLAAMIDGYEVRIFEIQRNDALIGLIVEAETELWERIQTADPPEPDWTHPRTADLVKELHHTANGLQIELSQAAATCWDVSERIGQRLRRLEKLRDALRSRVAFEVGDASLARLPDGRMLTRKIVQRAGYAVAAKSYPQISEQKQPDEPKPSKAAKPTNLLAERKTLLALDPHCSSCGAELTLRTSQAAPTSNTAFALYCKRCAPTQPLLTATTSEGTP